MIVDALAHPPADGDLVLEPLGERHRAVLKAACAEDLGIWQIYGTSFAPEQFDASFDALTGNGRHRPFAVMLGGALVAMSTYMDCDENRQVVEIGFTYLRPKMRGTGFNARLKRLMLGHAFASGIRRVEFRVDDRNARSKAAVAKIGGLFEGLLRADRITWNGHVRDTALFAILKDEWTA